MSLRSLSVGCALAALGLVANAPALPAAAHSNLVSTVPAAGATVETAPTEVSATFDGPLQVDFVQMSVSDATTGVIIGTVGPVVAGPTVTLPVPALPAGPYEVSYRVISADGHPVSGSFAFTVAAPAASTPTPTAAPPPTPTPTVTATAAAEPTSADPTTPTRSESPARWALLAALSVGAAAVGVVAYVLSLRTRRGSSS